MKEIKDDRNKWKVIPCFHIGRINIVKMTISPKNQCKLFKLLMVFFEDLRREQRGTNSLLMKVKEESEKAGLKLSIQKSKITHPVPSLFGNYMGK